VQADPNNCPPTHLTGIEFGSHGGGAASLSGFKKRENVYRHAVYKKPSTRNQQEYFNFSILPTETMQEASQQQKAGDVPSNAPESEQPA
jgi:hypothetical protein